MAKEPENANGLKNGTLNAICKIKVQDPADKSVKEMDFEGEYLPEVVQCENGAAPYESLKAQAIAARTYAYYFEEINQQPIESSQRHQQAGCRASSQVEKAVKATNGVVLQSRSAHLGWIIPASFYHAGKSVTVDKNATKDPIAACKDHQEKDGKATWSNNKPSAQGNPSDERNVGGMSQNGANCLAKNFNYSVEEILKVFYRNIQLVRAEGSCVRGEIEVGTVNAGPASNQPGASANGDCTYSLSAQRTLDGRLSLNATAKRGFDGEPCAASVQLYLLNQMPPKEFSNEQWDEQGRVDLGKISDDSVKEKMKNLKVSSIKSPNQTTLIRGELFSHAIQASDLQSQAPLGFAAAKVISAWFLDSSGRRTRRLSDFIRERE